MSQTYDEDEEDRIFEEIERVLDEQQREHDEKYIDPRLRGIRTKLA